MWGGSRCGATCHLLPFPPPLCLQSVNGCGCLNGSLILMESGCYYNLNLYCHADGRNQHPIRHSFICLTFKRSAECQCWRCVCVGGGRCGWGRGGRVPWSLSFLTSFVLREGEEVGSWLQHLGSPFPGSKPVSRTHDLKALLPPDPTHTL